MCGWLGGEGVSGVLLAAAPVTWRRRRPPLLSPSLTHVPAIGKSPRCCLCVGARIELLSLSHNVVTPYVCCTRTPAGTALSVALVACLFDGGEWPLLSPPRTRSRTLSRSHSRTPSVPLTRTRCLCLARGAQQQPARP